MVVPYVAPEEKTKRTVGIRDGKVTITFADDFKMTEEELAGLR